MLHTNVVSEKLAKEVSLGRPFPYPPWRTWWYRFWASFQRRSPINLGLSTIYRFRKAAPPMMPLTPRHVQYHILLMLLCSALWIGGPYGKNGHRGGFSFTSGAPE